MKKVDLHIHTSSSPYENEIVFSIDKLIEYVDSLALDIIAITNHNHFDRAQYETILSSVNCEVYPGVEVDIESSHMLLIVPKDRTEELQISCNNLLSKIHDENDSITYEDFITIFPNYRDYILIPHIKKNPSMKKTTLDKFDNLIKNGEVKSAKKFEVMKKESNSLVPVVFSDIRIDENISEFPIKFTYIDIVSTEFSVLKCSLFDKNKVFISSNKNEDEFTFLKDGTTASTKLNVIMGKRSSGKTYNLKQIYNSIDEENIKFVKQFSLTGKSEEEKFNKLILEEQQNFVNEYLEPLRKLTDIIINITDTADNDVNIYIDSLKDAATNQALQDSYSKTILFNELEFGLSDNYDTKNVINALTIIIESEHNTDIIFEKLSKDDLITILKKLVIRRQKEFLEYKLKLESDKILKIIKDKLSSKSSMIRISDINIYNIQRERILIKEYNRICNILKEKSIIYDYDVYRFKLQIIKKAFENSSKVKETIKTNVGIAPSFNNYYSEPYKYIKSLENIGIHTSEIYKTLISFDAKVINSDGFELSGGERAEYNLLREIKGAEYYDILLLDEPEASFDNMFIKDYIIDILKNLSQKTTIFITTHNNSLGILLKPNKIIYTSNNNGTFEIFTGELGSKKLSSVDGKNIMSYETIMNVMEAGTAAYIERKDIYETFKN